MSKTFKLAAVAALCAAAAAAHADVKFDANFEGDTTNINAASDSFKSGGRIEVNANAALLKQGDNFVNARASLLLGLNADSTVDDAWIQFGNSSVDLKIGRFEAVDLFPVGKDTVLELANSVGYRANVGRGRFKDGQFHGALGLNAAPGLRFELGVVGSNGLDNKEAEYAKKFVESAVRPAVTYTTGDLTLRAGFESFDKGTGSKTGYGLSAGYALAKDASVNVNYANSSDLDSSSVGANLTYGPAGIGYVKDKTGATTVDTVYAAYSFPLLGVKGASITPAISTSSGGTGVADKTALRVRLNYQF